MKIAAIKRVHYREQIRGVFLIRLRFLGHYNIGRVGAAGDEERKLFDFSQFCYICRFTPYQQALPYLFQHLSWVPYAVYRHIFHYLPLIRCLHFVSGLRTPPAVT